MGLGAAITSVGLATLVEVTLMGVTMGINLQMGEAAITEEMTDLEENMETMAILEAMDLDSEINKVVLTILTIMTIMEGVKNQISLGLVSKKQTIMRINPEERDE